MAGIFHMEGSVTTDFMEISKFPEILGELSICKQCVPGSSFSTHTREPGNEAKLIDMKTLPTFQCNSVRILAIAQE